MRTRIGQSVVVGAALAALLGTGCTSRERHRGGQAEYVARPSPEMQDVLDKLAALGGKPLETLTPAEALRQPTPTDAVLALLRERDLPTTPQPVGRVEDRSIPGPTGQLPVRIYSPQVGAVGALPVVVYFHGGGWVIADLDTYDASARAIAEASDAIVVSVHYRQAPENPFPAAVDDAFAAYRWALDNARSLGGDPQRVAVAGESAGGNLATVTCLRARDEGVPLPVHQLLIYPVVDDDFDTPSYREFADAKPLNRAMMPWFFGHYVKGKTSPDDPYLTPLHADLHGLPPATVITAEIDPLRSEGEAYANALSAAGVPVHHRDYVGVTHEFFGMGAVVPTALTAVQFAGEQLRESFQGRASK